VVDGVEVLNLSLGPSTAPIGNVTYTEAIAFTRRKIEIKDSINNSILRRLGLKLPINDSNNVFGFESLSMSRLCTRGYILSKC
jgi:hypothetical protein